MKKTISYILISLSVLILFGCALRKSTDDGTSRHFHVLVIHCYDSNFSNYREYDNELARSLRKQGILAEIRNIYQAGLLNAAYSDNSELAYLRDSLGWIPDIVCFFDDRTLSHYMEGRYSVWMPELDSIPVVAAGLHCPDWNRIRDFDNMAIMTDLIDFQTNLRLATALATDSAHYHRNFPNIVHIGLDYDDTGARTGYDARVRAALDASIGIPPFVNNSDWHIKETRMSDLAREYRDSIIVMTISIERPEKNAYVDDYMGFYKATRQHANESVILNVKKDIHSDALLNHSQMPQFSAIRDGFGDGLGRTLCGYFASYSTVARDQAEYIARILKGETASSLPTFQHTPSLYMDWDAMKKMDLNIRDYQTSHNPYARPFEIVNAPFRIIHPVLFYLLVLLALVGVGILVSFIVRLLFITRDKNNKKLMYRLEVERKLFDLALKGAYCQVVTDVNDIVALEDRVYPDDRSVLGDIMGDLAASNKSVIRNFRIMNESTGKYNWWQFRTGESVKSDDGTVVGILLDIDESYRNSEDVRDAALLATEVTSKENFLMNISHEIRTPLNGIVGFSQVLGTDDGSMSSEDRQDIGRMIRENAIALEEMIENILQYSRMESGRTEMLMEEVEVGQLISRVYSNWSLTVPENVSFELSEGRGGVYIKADSLRLEKTLDHYIRNAFDFASPGKVVLGWSYSLDDSMVKLFVEDSGPGISPQKQKLVFNLFWKDDMFQPGVGLGLTLSKMFTERMGGTVGLESQEGVGSCFSSNFKAYVKN